MQQHFLGTEEAKVPYIIGVAGSVAVGKSTTARVLQALLARWPNTPKVDLVTTDGFLLPNAVLEREGLMEKKGFPESYDLPALLRFLADIKAGRRPVRAPIYSHLVYDVVPNQWVEIDRPDILIVEGLNVLQAGRLPKDGKAIPFVSDFFDFSVYIDAEEDVLRALVCRPLPRAARAPRSAIRNPTSIAIRNSRRAKRSTTATSIWERINLVNLRENILPTRQRARPDPEEGREPPGRGSVAAEACSARRERRGARREHLGQPLAVERLDQEIVHAGGEARLAILAERIGGERDDRRARRAASARPRGCGAPPRCRRAGHVHVHQHEIVGRAGGAAAREGLDRGRAVGATVGRCPSRVSSARASSALISLSSATRIARPLRGRARARSRASPASCHVGIAVAASPKRAASEAARTGLTR